MKKRGRGRVVSEPDFDHALAGSDPFGDKILSNLDSASLRVFPYYTPFVLI